MKNVLIVGKSGFIGRRISEIIVEKNLNYNIYSGGRQSSSDTKHYQIDVYKKETLNKLKNIGINLIVLCTSDKENNLLNFCIENSIDYLDITKPTEDLKEACRIVTDREIKSRVVFASGWMGGVVGGLIPKDINIEELKLYVYYSLEDISGKSSVDFLAENITLPFSFYQSSKKKQVRYFQNPEKYQFHFGIGHKIVSNFDLPDLYILNKSRRIQSTSAKITYGSDLVMAILRFCISLRIFSVLSTEARKKLFRSKGKGDKTSFDISYRANNEKLKSICVECTKGQAEITSFATVLNIEKLFTVAPRVYFSHEMYDNLELVDLLSKNEFINIR